MDNEKTQKLEVPVVFLTPMAVGKIKSLTANDPESRGKSLRVRLDEGGCSGYQYAFVYDDQKENDRIILQDGISVLIDPESAQRLRGSTIDYKEDFGSEGFAIENPNVKKSCGCGHSVEL